MNIRLIAAIDDKRGLAKKGDIPWVLPTDTRYYREKVKDSSILVGWNTYQGMRSNPAGKRQIVVANQIDEVGETVRFINDIPHFFQNLQQDIWVIGGGSIFAQTIKYATELYLTRVSGDFDCDVFFPSFEQDFICTIKTKEQRENGITFRFEVWGRRRG